MYKSKGDCRSLFLKLRLLGAEWAGMEASCCPMDALTALQDRFDGDPFVLSQQSQLRCKAGPDLRQLLECRLGTAALCSGLGFLGQRGKLVHKDLH